MSGVLVTGAARGIGASIVERLARDGRTVGVLDRAGGDAADVARRLREGGGEAIPLTADVTDEEGVSGAVETLADTAGGIDGLVNNAGGFSRAAPLLEIAPDEWDDVVAANLRGAFLCSRASLPYLRASAQPRIVNVASVAGRTAVAGASLPYSAAKAGLIGFTRTLAVELASEGIAVNAIAPGLVATDRVVELHGQRMDDLLAQVPAGRLARVDEIAAAVAYLLGPEAGYLVGATIDINGGRIPI